MPPSGMLTVSGVRMEVTFYKGLFEKLGIQADMLQVGDYKGAAEPLTRDKMSPEFRKQMESVHRRLLQPVGNHHGGRSQARSRAR